VGSIPTLAIHSPMRNRDRQRDHGRRFVPGGRTEATTILDPGIEAFPVRAGILRPARWRWPGRSEIEGGTEAFVGATMCRRESRHPITRPGSPRRSPISRQMSRPPVMKSCTL